jgi:hypothetical protein
MGCSDFISGRVPGVLALIVSLNDVTMGKFHSLSDTDYTNSKTVSSSLKIWRIMIGIDVSNGRASSGDAASVWRICLRYERSMISSRLP